MDYNEALESQKGAQFFKSHNNSLDFKHSIAEHFFYLGQKSNEVKVDKLIHCVENFLSHHKDRKITNGYHDLLAIECKKVLREIKG